MRYALTLLVLFLAARAAAQDFSALTVLAEGALAGVGVNQPVEGFEIRLLQDGQVLYHRAFGDWTLGRPANADSSSKTLSGALVVSVAESGEGGFSLSSRLADFLPEFDRPGYRDITVAQAFSHSSGLPGEDVSSPILLAPGITLRQAAYLVSQLPLENGPPGSTFAYGGLSMQAVGAAMEVATGKGFNELFNERLAGPLGMTSTSFVLASATNPRVAGGAESTAEEFGRLTDLLLNGGVDRATGTRVLSEASVAAMLTRQTTDAQPIAGSPIGNNRYGIGVWLDQLGEAGPSVDFIAGGARGFHSWADASEGLVFTFATDLTTFQNVEPLTAQMHLAILEALVTPGDFNDDGLVDAADYTVWRDAVGTPASALPNDLDGGVVGVAQYARWAEAYGAAGTAITVPEPAGVALALVGVLCCRRRLLTPITRTKS